MSNESDNDAVAQKTPEVVEIVSDAVNTVLTVTEESDRVEEEDVGDDGDVLAEGVDVYDDVEAEGEQGDGTVTGVTAVETIQQSQENPMNGSREELIRATADDHSLTKSSWPRRRPMDTGGRKAYL